MVNVRITLLVTVLLGLIGDIPVRGENVTTSLIGHVLQASKDENIVFSPYLVTESLMLLCLGAEGETAKQLENMLHINSVSKYSAIRDFAKKIKRLKRSRYLRLSRDSRIYTAEGVNIMQRYQQKISDLFNTTVEPVDFGNSEIAVSHVNDWIAKTTDNKMNRVITEIANDTQLMLLSTLSFQGKWKHSFNVLETRKASFYIPQKSGDYRTVLVDTMKRKGEYTYGYIYKLNAYAIELPYASSDVSMTILLPRDMDGVDEVLQKLDSVQLQDITPYEFSPNFRILLPKFRIGSMLKLKTVLQSLGIHDIFSNASLPAMTGSNEGLLVNEIIHKINIEVDEKGSKATKIKKLGFGAISRQFVADVNHPFVFLIKDRKTIYLAGRVNTLE